ncbi:MAG TPA: tetratricopeptide repeat protein [Terriglobia bacterium]|nr:tetratricopeptide repeat protein [Terriglobia bacterium]
MGCVNHGRRGGTQSRSQTGWHSRSYRFLILLFLISFSSSAWAQGLRVQQGVKLLQQGRYADALPEFEAAAREHPQNAGIENVLGIIETKLGHLQTANQHYKKAILLSPNLEEAHKNLGVNYLSEKRYPLAEAQLKTAASLNSADPFAHYYLALLYLSTGRDQQAVEQLAPSQQLFQNDPQASFEMAEACLRLGKTKAALPLIDSLEHGTALSPSQEYPLAVLLFERQAYPQAVELFRRMVEADPESRTNRYNLAIGLLRTQKPAEAAALLEPLEAARPKDASILSLLGTAYEAEGKSQKALEAYARAMQADPGNPNRYLEYTRLLMNAGRYDESERFIAEGLKLTPDAYALDIRMGAVQMMLGKYDEARASFQKAIQVHPEIPLGYVALAETYLRRQQNQQAAEVLAEARRKLPNQFALEYFYGQALLRLGQNSRAVQILKDAVALKPSAPEAHFQLGKVYLETNRLNAALNEFERTIALAPQDSNAYYELSRIYARQGETAKAREAAARSTELKQKQYDAALKAQGSLLNAVREQQTQ